MRRSPGIGPSHVGVDMDALAAVALTIVILPHWLLTTFTATNQVTVTSVLTTAPWWAPAVWLPHLALTLLFIAAGRAHATASWPAAQMVRPMRRFWRRGAARWPSCWSTDSRGRRSCRSWPPGSGR